jgi:hypothetical protein
MVAGPAGVSSSGGARLSGSPSPGPAHPTVGLIPRSRYIGLATELGALSACTQRGPRFTAHCVGPTRCASYPATCLAVLTADPRCPTNLAHSAWA